MTDPRIQKEREIWSIKISINRKMKDYIRKEAFNQGILISRLTRKLLCDWAKLQRETPIRKIIKKIQEEEKEQRESEENKENCVEEQQGDEETLDM